MWYIRTRKYHSTTKRNGELTSAAAYMSLKTILLKKEAGHNDNGLHHFTYLKFLEKVKLQRQKTDPWYPGLGNASGDWLKMAAHSSILAWGIPRTGEPGGLQSTESQESDTTEWLNQQPKSKWWCEHLPRRASTNTITLRQKTKGKEIWTELLVLLSHFSCVQLCATPSLGFSRQEHWSGSPFPSPMHAEKWKVKVKSLSHVRLFETPWTAAYQAPLSMRFSRQEYWSGLPLPSPLDWANIT